MGKPFTPERLANIRRMRKARRLFRKQPLFAYTLMVESYPGYCYLQFVDDLRLRRPRKRKKGKSPLVRYGRYNRMEELKAKYRNTGNIDYAIQAQKLRKHLTKPYRVQVRLYKQIIEYNFSPVVNIREIEQLVEKLSACENESQADIIVADFRKTSHFG